MNPQDLTQFLDELGKRIGPYGQHAWELLVRQQQIESGVWIIGSLFCLIAICIVYAGVWHITRNTYDKEFPRGFAAVFALLGAGTAVFLLFYNVVIFLNPEYYAIKAAIGFLAR